jgi:MFS family permease
MASILAAVGAFAFPAIWAFILGRVGRSPWTRQRFLATWACSGAGGAVAGSASALINGGWVYPVSFGASGLLALILWWLSRRKRKRSLLEILGYKMRAVFARITRRMPGPGPVLRPVTRSCVTRRWPGTAVALCR